MKLKVGEYIRFKDKRGIQYIRKIVKLPEDTRYASIYIDKPANNVTGVSLKNVLNHSFNKIKLIEVGDYVNGYFKVSFIEDSYEGKFVQCDYPVQEGTTNHYRFYENDIKSIVTKEQYQNCEYHFEEE